MLRISSVVTGLALVLAAFLLQAGSAAPVPAPDPSIGSLYRLWDGETRQTNSLWLEDSVKFGQGRSNLVIADLKGPAIITMIHFALPAKMKLNRDLVLRAYWDGEKAPSIESPLVDFFCDPNGQLERVDTALVNKKRGWNCYFPMPFAKSARIEIRYDGARNSGASWDANPCYCYVMYHTVKELPEDAGYFHALWRQEVLLLGKQDYEVLDARGKGQFIGWNVTVRGAAPGSGYPVDENVKFCVDGETEPSIEWQGIEDSFGFSWGFPEQGNSFPYTGYQSYYNGAAAYRFTLNDRVSFDKSLKMTVGFGKNDDPGFREGGSKPGSELEFSSVAYWYQKEPHRAFPQLAAARDRRPSGLFVPADPAETIVINCGSDSEDAFLKAGWDYELKKGFQYSGWKTPVKSCWADEKSIEFSLLCPKGTSGNLRLFILDGDGFGGGRKESISVCGRAVGEYDSFQSGKWVEAPVSASDTADGRILVVMKNLKSGSNAVVSTVRFIISEAQKSGK